MRGIGWTLAGTAALALTVAGPARPQDRLDPGTRREVAEAAAGLLERNYVDPDVGRELGAMLRREAAADDASRGTDPAAFARGLTEKLNGIAHDLHLVVLPPPPRGGPAGRDASRPRSPGAPARGEAEPPPDRRPRSRPAAEGRSLPTSFQVLGAASPDERARMEAGIAARAAEERRSNAYFRAAEVLPGNVGYLDLDQFPIMPQAAPAADAAMMFLADVDAFILDLRGNPGGAEGMSQYLSSFFFTDSVPLYARYFRPDDRTRRYWTRPGLPPVHLPGVPLFVLTDARTGSAAETMAFSLQSAGRATVVGESTAGAGHSSRRMALPGGFSMVVPIARVFDPRTDREFEGTGVQPDVEAAPADALAAAHRLAIDSLLARTRDPSRTRELQQAAVLYAARSAPPLSPGELAAYAGTYGARRVRAEHGRLTLQRTDVQGAPPLVLLRTGPDRFVVEAMPRVKVEFTRGEDGGVRTLRVLGRSGRWEEAPRGGGPGPRPGPPEG